MVQKVLPLNNYPVETVEFGEEAGAVGLRCEDNMVTLRFMPENSTWGQPARQIRIERRLAEQLSRLLADELEDYR